MANDELDDACKRAKAVENLLPPGWKVVLGQLHSIWFLRPKDSCPPGERLLDCFTYRVMPVWDLEVIKFTTVTLDEVIMLSAKDVADKLRVAIGQ